MNGCVVAYLCAYGNAGNESGHASRTYKDVASPKWQAWQWANTRKGYWRTVHSPILTRSISNENLKRAHYPTLTEYYEKMHQR